MLCVLHEVEFQTPHRHAERSEKFWLVFPKLSKVFKIFQNLTLNTINMQKPHVALFYHWNKPQEKQWADILSFVEYTFSNLIFSHDLVVY
jgi:hypothetical protein